jgi:cysteine desulfurase
MPSIYLDHSATTPVAPDVLQAMMPYFLQDYGNAASLHAFGRDAAAALDAAHSSVACEFGVRPSEVIFTGCGTESDNLALRGVALAMRQRNRGNHIVYAAAEHHAVEYTVHQLRDVFGFEVTEVPVTGTGFVDPDAIKRAIRPNTVLASVMTANNEVGTLQAIGDIGAICRERNVIFHSDAVQCPAYMPLNMHALNVDVMSFSAHKFYGPKGVGIMLMREGTPYLPTLTGGGHERGRRAGTVNVAGAVGAAAALKFVARRRNVESSRLSALRDQLIAGVLADVPDAKLSGDSAMRLPHHASFVIKGVDGEMLLMSLDVEDIAVSTGSACTSGTPEPSSVLMAMGIAPEWALGGLRITLGYNTTPAEIDYVIETMPKCVERVRKAL